MKRIRQFLVSRFWDRTHAAGGIPTWSGELAVRHALNRRVSGSPDVWPIEWLASQRVERPFPRALSLGCGDGPLERDLMAKGLCESILGLDISEQAIELARQQASEAGHAALTYEVADLDRLHLEPASYEAVFVHQALHHVKGLEVCLDAVARALTPGGLFYLDEYVGPSRHEWSQARLAAAQEIFDELPKEVRRRRRLQLPVDWRDPSEAVRSSEIVPLVEERFEIRERRDYGGNLLAVIFPHLRLDRLDTAERGEIIDLLLRREDEMLAAGVPSYYSILLTVPRVTDA